MTATISYAAKATDDAHGSIPTQFADCAAIAARAWDTWEGRRA